MLRLMFAVVLAVFVANCAGEPPMPIYSPAYHPAEVGFP
jgi:hypothetical protein